LRSPRREPPSRGPGYDPHRVAGGPLAPDDVGRGDRSGNEDGSRYDHLEILPGVWYDIRRCPEENHEGLEIDESEGGDDSGEHQNENHGVSQDASGPLRIVAAEGPTDDRSGAETDEQGDGEHDHLYRKGDTCSGDTEGPDPAPDEDRVDYVVQRVGTHRDGRGDRHLRQKGCDAHRSQGVGLLHWTRK